MEVVVPSHPIVEPLAAEVQTEHPVNVGLHPTIDNDEEIVDTEPVAKRCLLPSLSKMQLNVYMLSLSAVGDSAVIPALPTRPARSVVSLPDVVSNSNPATPLNLNIVRRSPRLNQQDGYQHEQLVKNPRKKRKNVLQASIIATREGPCHTRFRKGNRMHPICAPGSSSAHTVDVTSEYPKQCINVKEYNSTLLHDRLS
jgi:hypothetical protein